MIAIISPAKTLDFETIAPDNNTTVPILEKKANFLASKLAHLTNSELATLLDVSPKLAQLNIERYANWKNAQKKQAIFAFDGDVYDGLDAYKMSHQQIDFAQNHLRILSGLYGYLKPLDQIKPHRLEMGTSLKTSEADSLYAYWTKQVTTLLNKDLKSSKSKALINLASNEYFSVVASRDIKTKIITPVFKDHKNGSYSIISFFAKKARGMMCRYMISNQITDYEMLVGFDMDGYNFNHGLSTSNKWVFTRG